MSARHPGFSRMFQPGRLTLGVFFPIEAFEGANPTMDDQVALARRACELGFAALWFRDVPLLDPHFGDIGALARKLAAGKAGVKASDAERVLRALDRLWKKRGHVAGKTSADIVFLRDLIDQQGSIAYARRVAERHAQRFRAQLERLLLEENFRIRQEKLEAERQLRQSEAQQALILRSLPIAVYSSDLQGGLAGPRFVGDDIAEILGYSSAQFASEPGLWVSRIHEEDRPRVLTALDAIIHEGAMASEYRWLCADGTERVPSEVGVI